MLSSEPKNHYFSWLFGFGGTIAVAYGFAYLCSIKAVIIDEELY
jgi:hypothetical protein